LIERFGESQNSVVSGICHVEIAGRINCQPGRSRQASGKYSASWTLRKGTEEIRLSDYFVRVSAILELRRVTPCKDAIIPRVAHIKDRRRSGCIDGYRSRGIELTPVHQVRRETVDIQVELSDDPGRIGIESDLRS
jgi:hypothetical protein